ncbi:ankyrin repeat-containing protein [Corchorus capsularis]|uniref:Ankyrin repeat-containing protein n=1 Tax=Corchorus capsularis TaxID=210143 RepID=A0A1R3GJS5_COCAP|nr:ankyrin repeat-containing protein [Corchorus capsularis]
MDKNENTALHLACKYKHLDEVKTLIQEDPEEFSYYPNNFYETPLYITARNGGGQRAAAEKDIGH